MEFYLRILPTIITILFFFLAGQRDRIRRKLLCAALRIRLNAQANRGLVHLGDSILLLQARLAFFCHSLHTYLRTALLAHAPDDRGATLCATRELKSLTQKPVRVYPWAGGKVAWELEKSAKLHPCHLC